MPPLITSIVPDSAYVNDTITINGNHFDPDPFNISVLFSGVEAFNIVKATTTSLRVKVPKAPPRVRLPSPLPSKPAPA